MYEFAAKTRMSIRRMYVTIVKYVTLIVYICYHNPDKVRLTMMFFRVVYFALRDADFKAAMRQIYFAYTEHGDYSRMRQDVTNVCINHLLRYVEQ
jgi:hypothetical protein